MTAALLAPTASSETRRASAPFPIRLRREDSLRRIALPPQPLSAAMVWVCAGSLIVHAALLAVTIVTNRAPVMPPHNEIAIEIVQEAPESPPQKVPAPEKPPLRLDAARPEASKSVPTPAPQPAQAKPPESNTATAKADPPKPPSVAPAQPTQQSVKVAPKSDDADTLRKELAELQAQRAALKSEAQALQSDAPAEGGPLKGSQQALALPSIGGDDGEVVGYQQLVFSQLAKAKGMDAYEGEAGVTGIRFEVDAAGQLISAQVEVASGKPMLDAKALDIVRRAAPFPPPPKDGQHVFFANVNFRPPKRS